MIKDALTREHSDVLQRIETEKQKPETAEQNYPLFSPFQSWICLILFQNRRQTGFIWNVIISGVRDQSIRLP